MRNDALTRALARQHLTPEDLAERIDADPLTVRRWLTDAGRTPQPRLRLAVAQALEVSEVELWPAAARTRVKIGAEREILAAYPSHGAVPDAAWQSMINDADREIVLAGYGSYYWLSWKVPKLAELLRRKASNGCRIRCIVGDPAMQLVAQEEEATGLPLTLTARINATLHLLEQVRDVVQVRRTGLGFGRSVYRGDNLALADWWLAGQPGSDFPVLHLHRQQTGGLFDAMAIRHVDALWEVAAPVW
jgi:transcriptional regulator with XRE-family HTH domain